jgi:hypothetical protein
MTSNIMFNRVRDAKLRQRHGDGFAAAVPCAIGGS